MNQFAIVVIAALLVASCGDQNSTTGEADSNASARALSVDATTSREFAQKHKDFKSYWFRGLAEMNRFELKQSRYGEIHEGEAVMVFVTEPFLRDKQVKSDVSKDPNAVQILKNNFYRRFYTGVYPYTIMTSTFTPASGEEPTIKLSETVQDWCGQFFAQLNLNPAKDGFDAKSFSYFQSGGDQQSAIASTLIEDDLFTRVRLGPDKLPTGELDILPSATYVRLAHKDWTARKANATLSTPAESEFSDVPVRTYTIAYPEPARTLKIHFEADFPYRIVAFEDTYSAIFNPHGGAPQKLTTVGRLTNSIMLDYWAKHTRADGVWRDALGLQF